MHKLGCTAQSVTCLAADPGVASSISTEIEHEMIPLIQEGVLSVTSESVKTKYWLTAK